MKLAFWRRDRDPVPAPTSGSWPVADGAVPFGSWDPQRGQLDPGDRDPGDPGPGDLRARGQGSRDPEPGPAPSDGPVFDDADVGVVPEQVVPLLKALHRGDTAAADALCTALRARPGPPYAAQMAVHGVLSAHLSRAVPAAPGTEENRLQSLEVGEALARRALPELARLAPAAEPAAGSFSVLLSSGLVRDESQFAELARTDPVLSTRVAAVLLLVELGDAPLEPLLDEVRRIYG